MKLMGISEFEALYRAQGDPWGYRSSAYEDAKYHATLDACGPGPFASALELGASIGVFTGRLAPRCRGLVTLDAAFTAVTAAREHLGQLGLADSVDVRLATIPDGIPPGPFDLVVASEILYYLPGPKLAETLDRLQRALQPGARLVAVHWRPGGPERPHTADTAHQRLREQPWLALAGEHPTADYLLDVFERR